MPTHQWVLVAGTGRKSGLPTPVGLLATALGSALAAADLGLVVGGWPGVDYLVSEAYASVAKQRRIPLSDRLIQVVGSQRPIIYPDGAGYPDFRGGHLIEVPSGLREWVEALKYSDAVVLLGGEGGTLETFRYALQEQRPVLPVQSSGGDAVAAFRDCLERWEMLPLGGFPLTRFEQVLSAPVTHSEDARDVAQGVLGLLEAHFDYEAAGRPRDNAIFVSYAHEDGDWLNRLRSVLRPLEKTAGVSVWTDVTLKPGAIFEQEIRHAIATAQVAILLVSDAFSNSTFIQEKELPWLLDRQASGSLTIMWLHVQGQAWRETSLAEILAASDHGDSALDNLSMAQQQDEMVKIRNSIAAVLATDRRQRIQHTA